MAREQPRRQSTKSRNGSLVALSLRREHLVSDGSVLHLVLVPQLAPTDLGVARRAVVTEGAVLPGYNAASVGLRELAACYVLEGVAADQLGYVSATHLGGSGVMGVQGFGGLGMSPGKGEKGKGTWCEDGEGQRAVKGCVYQRFSNLPCKCRVLRHRVPSAYSTAGTERRIPQGGESGLCMLFILRGGL